MLEEERNKYKKEDDTFYKVYFAVLDYTNNLYHINPKLKKIYKQNGINPSELIGIVENFWKDKDIIISKFLKENPYHFKEYENSLVDGMRRGFRDIFFLARYEREYTCLLGKDKCYMIKGIHDNIDNIISYKKLPCMVVTAIVPFDGKIIYDGIFQSSEGISFGSSFESMIEEELEKSECVY